MKYYPITKKWRKIKPHIENKIVQDALVHGFNKYTMGLWSEPFRRGMKPRHFETCDWDWNRRGRRPEYWDYVKHAACHWLVNFNLELAKLVEPNRNWRIVTSQKHSTVWDGEETLFDFNFTALQISPNEAYRLAGSGKELPIGKKLRVYFAERWSVSQKKEAA